jgi:homoserine kinase type II
MIEREAKQLCSDWSFLADFSIESSHQGTNHLIFVIDGSVGKFILKLYGNAIATAQIHYEHRLLKHLQKKNLSFTIPTPIATDSGKTLEMRDRNSLRLALFPYISGQQCDRQNPRHAYIAGQALGELHQALTDFDPQGQRAQLPAWGELNKIHPLVRDVEKIPAIVNLDSKQHTHLCKLFSEVLETAPSIYQSLPIQTIHADYLSLNVLIECDRVVGILDFEFATRDLRLVDFICGLDDYAMLPWSTISRWEFIKEFSAGYAKACRLSLLEINAIPKVWRLQRSSSLVYWSGWLLEGKVSLEKLRHAIAQTLSFDLICFPAKLTLIVSEAV